MLRTPWSIFSEQKRDSLVSFQRAATREGVGVGVSEVMDHLPDGPSAGAVGGVDLGVIKPVERAAELTRLGQSEHPGQFSASTTAIPWSVFNERQQPF